MRYSGKWKRGGGEFIGFTISIIFLVEILLLLIGFSLYQNASTAMEDAVTVISRDVVTCKSLDEARTQAEKDLKEYFYDSSSLPKDSLKIDVYYAPGSDMEWKKGNFIQVYLSGDIKTCEPFTSRTKEVFAMAMIEKNEE